MREGVGFCLYDNPYCCREGYKNEERGQFCSFENSNRDNSLVKKQKNSNEKWKNVLKFEIGF